MSTRINPYKLFVGSFLPNWLLCRTEIGLGAKVTYARLAQYAGEEGECFPKLETLGVELGVSSRMVQNYIGELEGFGLIESERIGLGQPNRYYFLRHAWMTETISTLDRKDSSTLDRKDSSTLDRKDSSTPTIKRISRRESVEESSGATHTTKVVGPDVEKLVSEFAADFSAAEVQEHIADSLAHVNAKKWTDKTRYCRNWLKRAAEDKQRRGATNGTSGQRATPYPAAGRVAGMASSAPAGPLTEAERYARRVTRYQA